MKYLLMALMLVGLQMDLRARESQTGVSRAGFQRTVTERSPAARRSFKELKKAMEAPVEADKPKYLGWVADLKKAAEESKTLEPEKTERVPAEQKTAFLDGLAARQLGLSSVIGKDLDSLADMISFGVAPGILMFIIIALRLHGDVS